jgi:molybdopterin-containing oxidoreductase family iron-sulfur binding subunit
MQEQLNPDVTVRGRGVMEKCTFCIQRIHYGEEQARKEARPMQDSDIVPACAQSCPTQAIVFGDFSNPTSAIHELIESPRAIRLLNALGTDPAVIYLKGGDSDAG